MALEAVVSNKASPSGLSALDGLQQMIGSDYARALQLAENAIRQMQYDPFVPGSGLGKA